MKLVSQLDENNYFVGVTVADESPLEPGVFLIPGGAIDVDPPSIPKNKVARWNNGWEFEEILIVSEPENETISEITKEELEKLKKEFEAKEAAKASALAKLEALGLTAEEAQAIAGF
jgi:hypothetical protein